MCERELTREVEWSSAEGKPGREKCWGPSEAEAGLRWAGLGRGLRKPGLPPGVKV